MPMTFKEASAKLCELAQGRFRAIEYQMLTHASGRVVPTCRIYIAGESYHSGATFEDAFRARAIALGQYEQTPMPEDVTVPMPADIPCLNEVAA